MMIKNSYKFDLIAPRDGGILSHRLNEKSHWFCPNEIFSHQHKNPGQTLKGAMLFLICVAIYADLISD